MIEIELKRENSEFVNIRTVENEQYFIVNNELYLMLDRDTSEYNVLNLTYGEIEDWDLEEEYYNSQVQIVKKMKIIYTI